MIRRKGFTLIELLIVVAIIAVLITILAPALQSAKKLATGSNCWSNMSLTKASIMFEQDINHEMVGSNAYYHWLCSKTCWCDNLKVMSINPCEQGFGEIVGGPNVAWLYLMIPAQMALGDRLNGFHFERHCRFSNSAGICLCFNSSCCQLSACFCIFPYYKPSYCNNRQIFLSENTEWIHGKIIKSLLTEEPLLNPSKSGILWTYKNIHCLANNFTMCPMQSDFFNLEEDWSCIIHFHQRNSLLRLMCQFNENNAKESFCNENLQARKCITDDSLFSLQCWQKTQCNLMTLQKIEQSIHNENVTSVPEKKTPLLASSYSSGAILLLLKILIDSTKYLIKLVKERKKTREEKKHINKLAVLFISKLKKFQEDMKIYVKTYNERGRIEAKKEANRLDLLSQKNKLDEILALLLHHIGFFD